MPNDCDIAAFKTLVCNPETDFKTWIQRFRDLQPEMFAELALPHLLNMPSSLNRHQALDYLVGLATPQQRRDMVQAVLFPDNGNVATEANVTYVCMLLQRGAELWKEDMDLLISQRNWTVVYQLLSQAPSLYLTHYQVYEIVDSMKEQDDDFFSLVLACASPLAFHKQQNKKEFIPSRVSDIRAAEYKYNQKFNTTISFVLKPYMDISCPASEIQKTWLDALESKCFAEILALLLRDEEIPISESEFEFLVAFVLENPYVQTSKYAFSRLIRAPTLNSLFKSRTILDRNTFVDAALKANRLDWIYEILDSIHPPELILYSNQILISVARHNIDWAFSLVDRYNLSFTVLPEDGCGYKYYFYSQEFEFINLVLSSRGHILSRYLDLCLKTNIARVFHSTECLFLKENSKKSLWSQIGFLHEKTMQRANTPLGMLLKLSPSSLPEPHPLVCHFLDLVLQDDEFVNYMKKEGCFFSFPPSTLGPIMVYVRRVLNQRHMEFPFLDWILGNGNFHTEKTLSDSLVRAVLEQARQLGFVQVQTPTNMKTLERLLEYLDKDADADLYAFFSSACIQDKINLSEGVAEPSAEPKTEASAALIAEASAALIAEASAEPKAEASAESSAALIAEVASE